VVVVVVVVCVCVCVCVTFSERKRLCHGHLVNRLYCNSMQYLVFYAQSAITVISWAYSVFSALHVRAYIYIYRVDGEREREFSILNLVVSL